MAPPDRLRRSGPPPYSAPASRGPPRALTPCPPCDLMRRSPSPPEPVAPRSHGRSAAQVSALRVTVGLVLARGTSPTKRAGLSPGPIDLKSGPRLRAFASNHARSIEIFQRKEAGSRRATRRAAMANQVNLQNSLARPKERSHALPPCGRQAE